MSSGMARIVPILVIISACITSCFSANYTMKSDKWVKSIPAKSTTDGQLNIYCREGEDKRLTKIWKKATLRFNFNETSSYELFDEPTTQQVQLMYDQQRKSWFHFYPLQTTDVTLNLFNSTCVGVATSEEYRVFIEVKPVYSAYLAATIGAIFLFYAAKRLSKNIAFYYGTGVGIGVIASVLVLCFILSRLIPGKKAGIAIMLTGISSFLTAVQYLWRTQVLVFLEDHYDIVIGYIVISGLLSFILLYWYGPPSNPRSLDIVKWIIQLIALSMLYYSIQVREIAVGVMILLVTIYNFPIRILRRITWMWRVRFPPKPRLLTTEEFEQQADEFTRKALEDLKSYCKSPDCNAWKTIGRLKSPTRFADFVEGSFHLQDDELLSFDIGDSAEMPPMTSDDDSDAEIDFRLSTR